MDPIILLLRVFVPLLIFRFPLFGGLSSLSLDGLDWWINIFGIENIRDNYQQLDKLLDIYYLSIEAYIVFRWTNKSAKLIGFFLYFYRMAGLLLFQLLGARIFLFIFPNFFESFFLFYLLCKKILGKEPKISPSLFFFSLVIIFIPKVIQEYPQHAALFWQWRHVQIRMFSETIILPYDNIIHQSLIIFGLALFVCILLRHQAKKMKHFSQIWKR